MKKLERMLLINWHYISKQMIEFSNINFLTGKNGSGKSTIIDALQLLLLGDTRGNFFNKAANDRTERTLEGYLRGEIGDVDIRKFGSQGQQRTAALSLKLSEIELVKRITKDTPVLLLDDVLSELDSNRQNYLLNSIGDIQTIITCTGLEEFVNNRFEINRVFKVSAGTVICVNENMGLKSDIEESPSDEYNFGSL